MLAKSISLVLDVSKLLRVPSALVALTLVSGCTYSGIWTPDTSPIEYEITEKFCEAPYTTIPANTSLDIVRPSPDSSVKTVTLKSASNYGYDESAYNLSDSCFSRKDKSCKVDDQVFFNYGGHAGDFQISKGQMTFLSNDDASKFEILSFANLDSLNLKSDGGESVTKATLFGRPPGAKDDAQRTSRNFPPGTTILMLFDDPAYRGKYEFYKLKIVEMVPGDYITFLHQRLAEADRDTVRNFVCSRRANLKSVKSRELDETTITPDKKTAFDFETGLNIDDRKYIGAKSMGQLIFDATAVNGDTTVVGARIAQSETDFIRIADVGDKALSEISRQSWPDFDSKGVWKSALNLKKNSTYLLTHVDEFRTFSTALRIVEIDSSGVRVQWKRITNEPPTRVVKFEDRSVQHEAGYGLVTFAWSLSPEYHQDSARTGAEKLEEKIKVDLKGSLFVVTGLRFPEGTGIIDVTSNYASLEAIPNRVDSNFWRRFKASEPVRMGSRYVLATETFKKRSVVIMEVVGFVPEKSVTVRFKRLSESTARSID